MDAKRWIDYGLRVVALILSFVAGSVTGSVASYVNVKTDEAALNAQQTITANRVTALEAEVTNWRLEDRDDAKQLKEHLDEVGRILNELRHEIDVSGKHRS